MALWLSDHFDFQAILPDRNQFLRCLPETRVDEIGGEAAHPRECVRLSGPDFEGTRLQRRKGLLYQLICSHQAGATLG